MVEEKQDIAKLMTWYTEITNIRTYSHSLVIKILLFAPDRVFDSVYGECFESNGMFLSLIHCHNRHSQMYHGSFQHDYSCIFAACPNHTQKPLLYNSRLFCSGILTFRKFCQFYFGKFCPCQVSRKENPHKIMAKFCE